MLHAVTARATVAGHASLVPLSCFPGPCRIRLALALLQSPDGHEVLAPPYPPTNKRTHTQTYPTSISLSPFSVVKDGGYTQVAAVEKEGLLESLKPHHTAPQLLQAALAALQAASASSTSPTSSCDGSPRRILESAADPPLEPSNPPRFLMGVLGTDAPAAGHGAAGTASSEGSGTAGMGVRMYSRGPVSSRDQSKVVATGHAARLALSCSPPGVSGALLHARYAVEWQTSVSLWMYIHACMCALACIGVCCVCERGRLP